jgi:hypothetical protein
MCCRAGTATSDGAWYGPGSAEQHFAPYRVRDTIHLQYPTPTPLTSQSDCRR